MNKPMVGMNALNGLRADTLENAIQTAVEFGFDCVELNLSALPMIIDGHVCQRMVDFARSVMEKYPIKYTGHIGGGLNLRNLEQYELHKNVLFSSIDICQALGMDRLTLHFEDASPIEKEEQAFFQAHVEANAYAAEKGVMLLMENIEIEDYRKPLEMVKRMNHPNFRMNLDVGHLYLSIHYFGGNFEQAVRECAPYVHHVHLNDNTGRFEKMRLENFAMYKTLNMGVRTAFGAGDIHLPPLWGEIPMEFIVQTLHDAGYQGIFLCEYENTLYLPFGKQIQQEVRALVNRIYGE